jgi:hypothetical protein
MSASEDALQQGTFLALVQAISTSPVRADRGLEPARLLLAAGAR